MIHKIICVCDCGGQVISRFDGSSGFCEACNQMYAEEEHNVFHYEK